MEATYEIRIFCKPYIADSEYYEGNDDVRLSCICNSVDNLIKTWKRFLRIYEGEAYSVWEHNNGSILIVGGAYDPNDIDYLNNYFGTNYEFEYDPAAWRKEFTPWVAVKLLHKKDMDITEHLAMNGYTFNTDGEHIIFVFDEEMPYVETILKDNKIKYERI